jgi:hypothetical protein
MFVFLLDRYLRKIYLQIVGFCSSNHISSFLKDYKEIILMNTIPKRITKAVTPVGFFDE